MPDRRTTAFALAILALGGSASARDFYLPFSKRWSQPDDFHPTPERWAEIIAGTIGRDRLRFAQPLIKDHISDIKAELRALGSRIELPAGHWGHEWAGEYRFPMVISGGASVWLAPSAGIAFTKTSCTGPDDGDYSTTLTPFDEDSDGTIDGVDAEFQLRTSAERFRMSSRLYFVRWDRPTGVARFIVPERDMLALVSECNSGTMSCPGYRREAPAEHPDRALDDVTTLPVLPAKWDAMILRERLTGRITAAERQMHDGRRALVVTIDKGSADGVYLGMQSPFADRDDLSVLVIALDNHECRATVWRSDFETETPAPPAIGDEILFARGPIPPDEVRTGDYWSFAAPDKKAE